MRWAAGAAAVGCVVCVGAMRAAPPAPNSGGARRAHGGAGRDKGTVTVLDAGKPVNMFRTDEALGAGVDGEEKGEIAKAYTPANIRAMRSAGLRPLTYRLRTELGVEAWHWNPRGRWSDPARKQGYWVSDPDSPGPILKCNGYRLPRRGSTIDQANNDGYSRIDDGDPATFWKSNPYLDRHYTGQDNAKLPQWFVIDLGKPARLDTIRILWGEPYATEYAVEYWKGPDAIYINENAPGEWATFPRGVVHGGRGGGALLRLADAPVSARFVRVVMTAASGTGPRGSTDIRDRLGYAVREVYLGTLDARGRLRDALKHGKANTAQTIVFASSTDPWHRASDLDPNVEQPGFDRVFRSGLTNGLPALVPAPVLYDNPENAVNALRYLKAGGYPIRAVEMGEEPDGQYVAPEDYGELYRQWTVAIRRDFPTLTLGGPCFQTTITDVAAWPDEPGNRSWLNRFLRYLDASGHAKDFGFFSFEWYPFDDVCGATAPQLARAPGLLEGVLARLQKDGLSRDIPWMITEYGYSAFAGRAEVDIPGALLNADIVGTFLALGGDVAYLYGYEPNTLIKESTVCDTWGNLATFLSDDDRVIKAPLPTYYAARLYATEWAQPGHGEHAVYAARSDVRNARGEPLVSSYAVRRPDGQWALMLINKDPARARTVRVRFDSGASFRGPVDVFSYSGKQYAWVAKGERGHPKRSLPPEHHVVPAGAVGAFALPPYSLTVARGRVAR